MENGHYHEDLLMVHPDRARSTARTQRGALNALLMVSLLQAEQRRRPPATSSGQSEPTIPLGRRGGFQG